MSVPTTDSSPGSPPKPASPAPHSDPPPVRKQRRLLVPLLLILAIAAASYAFYRAEHPPQKLAQLDLQGNIDVRQVNLGFKVDGRIETLAVDEGDVIKAGQVLASLDKRYFNDELRMVRARRDNLAANLARLVAGSRPEEIAEARANVAQRRATLARAERDFERAKGLVDQGAVSKETYDLAKATLAESEAAVNFSEQALRLAEIGPRQEDIDAARAQLAGEEAALIQSERRLADADLIAPSDGIILTRSREKGAIVGTGESVFTLTLATPVWVRTYVNERDLGRIEPGMIAEVHTDSSKRTYPGRIGFISPTAEFTPKTVETRELRTDLVYRLRVLVDNPDGGLRQGMPVTVRLRLEDRHPAQSSADNHSTNKTNRTARGE